MSELDPKKAGLDERVQDYQPKNILLTGGAGENFVEIVTVMTANFGE